jgi:hypothetical protein
MARDAPLLQTLRLVAAASGGACLLVATVAAAEPATVRPRMADAAPTSVVVPAPESLERAAPAPSSVELTPSRAAVWASGRKEPESRVRLRFVLPLWLPLLAMQSSTEARGSLTDLVQTQTAVRWVAMGMLELGYRPIIARADVFGIGFDDQLLRANGEPTNIELKSSALMARGMLMYEFGPYRLSRRHADRLFRFSPLLGVRYNRIATETNEQTTLAGHYDWFDPLVGVRDEFELGRWQLGMHTDVGGFNLSSDLAFWASATVEYMIFNWFSMWIGWQHYQVLFQRSATHGPTSLELVLTGPSAGFGFHVL